MNKKLTTIFLAMVMAIPLSSSIYAMPNEEVSVYSEKAVIKVESAEEIIDTVPTFNEINDILNDAHTLGLEVNDLIEKMLDEHHDVCMKALAKVGITEVAEAVKAKDKEAVINAMEKALNSVSGTEAAKADLKEAKSKIKEAKNILKRINSVDKTALFAFSDEQIATISDKIKAIEKDYVAFVKLIVNDYLQQYVGSIMEIAYGKSIDKAVDYANDVLDYVEEFKGEDVELDTKSLVNKAIKRLNINFTPDDVEKLLDSGYIDVNKYSKETLLNKFESEINTTIDFLAEEVIDFLANIETTLDNEIKAELNKNLAANETQTNIKGLTSKRFTTITKIQALKKRVDDMGLAKFESISNKIELVEPVAYDIFYSNIIMSIEKTMGLEKEKANKEYEFNETRGYILTATFMNSTSIYSKLGIPSANKSVLTFGKLKSSKIKTLSTMTIMLGENIEETYTYAVLGDVYADGMVDARDYMMIKNQIMEKETLDAVRLLAADTYRDNGIDARDYMMIKNQIMDKDKISL